MARQKHCFEIESDLLLKNSMKADTGRFLKIEVTSKIEKTIVLNQLKIEIEKPNYYLSLFNYVHMLTLKWSQQLLIDGMITILCLGLQNEQSQYQ
jgi:hypothetical protein